MSAAEKRLDRVAARLHPREAFLVWMAEAHQHPSLPAYVLSLKDAPDEAFPLYRLPDRVERMVMDTLKGQKPLDLELAIRTAVRDMVFYFELHQEVNVRLLQDWRAMGLNLVVAVGQVSRLIHDEAPNAKHLDWARERVENAALEFLLWQGVAQQIGQRYLGGTSPLFPEMEERLSELVGQAERAVGLYNDQVEWVKYLQTEGHKKGKRHPLPQPLDFAALREDVQPAVHRLAGMTVDMARAKAAEFMGERRTAAEIIRRRMWPDA